MPQTTKAQSRTPSLAEVLRAAIESKIEGLHVALPGKIELYDALTQKANISPMIIRRVATVEGEELIEPLPILNDVPIIFPRSNQFFISFPLMPGDHVLLVFNERSIDNFVIGAPGVPADPQDFRTHDLSDAVAFPGFWPLARALLQADPANMVLGADAGGIQVHLTPIGTVEIKQGGGVATFSLAIAEKLQALYVAAKAIYDVHVHPTGMGPSGPPPAPFPAWDATIASIKAKIQD